MKELFKKLEQINVNDHIDKRTNGNVQLSYLSWPWAIQQISENCESFEYEFEPWEYDEHLGYMVRTKVTIEGITKKMCLPVMDGANKAMKDHPYQYQVRNPNFRYAKWDKDKQGYFDKYGNRQEQFITKSVEPASMMDINKAQMRCLVKNIAMFGLGLYIYAGEDLPMSEEVDEPIKEEVKEEPVTEKKLGGHYDPNVDPGEAPDENVIKYLENQPEDFKQQALGYYGVNSIKDLTKMQAQHAVRILQNAQK